MAKNEDGFAPGESYLQDMAILLRWEHPSAGTCPWGFTPLFKG